MCGRGGYEKKMVRAVTKKMGWGGAPSNFIYSTSHTPWHTPTPFLFRHLGLHRIYRQASQNFGLRVPPPPNLIILNRATWGGEGGRGGTQPVCIYGGRAVNPGSQVEWASSMWAVGWLRTYNVLSKLINSSSLHKLYFEQTKKYQYQWENEVLRKQAHNKV